MRAPSLACSSPSALTRLVVPVAVSLFALALAGCPSPPKQVGDVTSENGSPKGDESPTRWEGASAPEEPKPKSSGGANPRAVNEAPRRRTDQYDKDATDVVLKRAARQVKENCGAASGDDGKASGPWGKTTVQIQLGSNGRSKGITVPSPYQGKPTGNCVEKAFANLTYPPWGGADAEIDWEIELVAPAETPKK
jgi:hypothetical protein